MVEKHELGFLAILAAIGFIAYLVIFTGDGAMARCELKFSHDTCVGLLR